MKLGYSLLLGEYCEAAFIEYGDCKAFQIVCPSCKEPVFKVTREPVEDRQIHYLSHYQKDEAYEAECELRVSRISEEEIERTNSLSRNQKIEYFLGVFREAVLNHEYPKEAEPQAAVKSYMRRLAKSKALEKVRELLFEFHRDPGTSYTKAKLNAYFDDYVTDIKEIAGKFFSTAYSLETQKRIGGDMWQHLLSAKTKENFFFLFNHGYVVLLQRLERAIRGRQPFQYELDLYKAMRRIPDANKEEGLAILDAMREYSVEPPHALEGSNLFLKLYSEVTHEMLGALLRLPYFEMLRQRKPGQTL